MKQLSILAVVVLSLSACRIEDESRDQRTFATFEKLCKEQASEFVDEGAAYGPLRLVDLSNPSFSVRGKADRGVWDSEYDPRQLLKTLLTGPDPLPQIRFVYRHYGYGSTVPGGDKACEGNFYADLTTLPFTKPGLSNCGQAKRWDATADSTRYVVGYDYGKLDENEIRRFTFQLRDSITDRVIVEQKSFQLLLGGMSARKNQSFTDLGWTQSTKTCRLSPPDLLIKQAFSKHCIVKQRK